jgi:hypothetical protein
MQPGGGRDRPVDGQISAAALSPTIRVRLPSISGIRAAMLEAR